MTRISIDALMTRLADLDTDETELAEFFILDEAAEGPFDPHFRLNPQTVDIPEGAAGLQRSAAALNAANWFTRMRRRKRFYNRMRKGYSGPVIVSEGDSWWLYPIRLKDTIDHLSEPFAIYSLGAAGDLLDNMADQQEYLPALRDTGASILLLSGGGNDLLAGGNLDRHLEAYHPDLNPGDYLKASFQGLLDNAFAQYERMFRQVRGAFPHVSILCHGYDYPIPDNGRWLGKPMAKRGINDRSLQARIAAEMMDQFNRGMRRLAVTMPHVTYVDCRTVVRDDRWHDELHPTNEGYGAVAALFEREIRRISNVRSGPPVVIGGPFGAADTLARAAMPAPALAPVAETGRGISLHLGLDRVDPAHYAGWDGALQACESDAVAMVRLAERQGFAPTLLLTEGATRAAVVEQVRRAARDLKAGDMFFFTVSAHGGRIPDWNGDEEDDGTGQPMDETLCLYDFQIADDELYMLWTEFAEGVRILMMPDTCHSGSMVRVNPLDLMLLGDAAGPKPREMPRHIETATWRQNLDTYRNHATSYSHIRESVILNPLTTPVAASVLNLGACQDHQQAMDGAEHGAFTGAVLKVWDGGRFAGDYATFRDRVDAEINSPSQTPNLYTPLVRDPAFLRQVPFTLWANPAGTVLGSAGQSPSKRPATAPVPPVAAVAPPLSPAATLVADEGDEPEEMTADAAEAIAAAKRTGAGFRNAEAALAWPDYGDFRAFVEALGLKHFAADEFLILGGSHGNPNSACHGRNSYPPRALWSNIANTAQALDALRARLGKPVVITNAYRAPDYNTCIGGATASQHRDFRALDFRVSGIAAPDVATALRWLRDKEGLFTGGIGCYNTFVHIDTRGVNVAWPDDFRDRPLPATSPLSGGSSRGTGDRIARLMTADLAPQRRGTPRSAASAFAADVPRTGEGFDPADDAVTRQQALKAAVSASSVVSFVDNLSPGQKEDVLLSTLFAQRAADAAADPVAAREEWYRLYMDILSVMGWTRMTAPFESRQIMQGSGSFDKVILSTLATVASGNQIAIANSAIEALRALADNDGAVRLFDFETTRTSGGNFQIGSAEAAGAEIALALGAFNFTHTDKRKNILFVSWGESELEFWLSAQKLILSPAIYDDVREVVKERLGATRKSLIADIPIG